MKKIIIFLMILFPVFSFASIKTTYLIVEGSGMSRTIAIRNALIEAVKQTNGVAISSKRVYAKAIKEAAISLDGQSSHGISISEKSQKRIKEATRGFIRKYRIIDSRKEGSEWIVKLRIKMLRYKTPGFSPNNRRKIAIIPFEYKNSYDILGSNESGKQISQRFTQALVSLITQARKFTVLDRQNNKYYQGEKNFILSGDTNKNAFLELGRRLGTDYLLIGQILNYSIKNIVNHNDIGLPETSKTVCSVTVSYRILVMATQQIKWSETISRNFNLPNNSSYGSRESLVAKTTNDIAGVILNHILRNIYPPRIIMVTSNSVIINQGSSSVHQGEIYNIYKIGQRLEDPYTHEFLGYEEIKSGQIEITTVRPKVSYAKVLSGVANKGMILREVKKKSKQFHSEGEATSNVKITPNGGVVLPFD